MLFIIQSKSNNRIIDKTIPGYIRMFIWEIYIPVIAIFPEKNPGWVRWFEITVER